MTTLPPEGISQQAWDEARAVYYRVLDSEPVTGHSIEIIARAIMAATERERERCALIADEHRKSPRYTDWPYATACADIAAAIRQGSQPSTSIPHMGGVS